MHQAIRFAHWDAQKLRFFAPLMQTLNNIMDIVFLIIFVAYMGWLLFAHIEYWHNLKQLAPLEYEALGNFKLFSTGGFPWIEHALTRKYKLLEIPELTVAGERLCKAYDSVGKVIGIGVTLVVVGGFIYALWYIFNNVI